MSDERITSLPVLSDLDGSEWLVVDDGSTTYRTPSDTYPKLRDTTFKVTVGSNGDYASLSAALEALGREAPALVNDGFTAEVELLSGFVLAEQILIRRFDASWVKLTSVDATVTVDRSALTVATIGASKPAFHGEHANLPLIDVAFSMDTSGTADGQSGFSLDHSDLTFGTANNKGFSDATRRNVDAHNESRVVGRNGRFNGAGNHNIRIGNRSSGIFRDVEAINAGNMNLAAGNGCHAHINDGILTGAGVSAVYSQGARVEADRVDGSSAGSDSFDVDDGGELSVHGATGTLSIPANTPTDKGIIYSDTLEVPDIAAPVVPELPASAPWQDADRAIGLRLDIPRRAIYRYILFRVDVSSGNIEVGLLRMSGTNLLTATTIMSSGSIACPAAGYVRLDLGATVVDPGPHVLYIAADNTTFETFNSNDSVALRAQRMAVNSANGPGADFEAAAWGNTTRYIGGIALEGDT